ncbi:MAG: hypothetical protein KBF52_05360 [Pyrinomonadaceae bacterium]|nr:hypothetical protein [Chloracidobacterium sp.]MBP9935178.1 hypothetical protein [Pyrinomonadaceae bacterium]
MPTTPPLGAWLTDYSKISDGSLAGYGNLKPLIRMAVSAFVDSSYFAKNGISFFIVMTHIAKMNLFGFSASVVRSFDANGFLRKYCLSFLMEFQP